MQDVLLTVDAASDVAAGMIATTLTGYLILYGLLISAFIGTLFYLARRAGHLPEPSANEAKPLAVAFQQEGV